MSIVFTHRRFSEEKIQDGTEHHPFLIKNAFDFKEFRDEILAGNNFEGIYHKLDNNIDLTGITYNTGINSPYYSGNFNGNFKILKNFTATNTIASDVVSLFGGNFNGKVYNLAIINATINRGSNTSSGGTTGIIGASISGSTIENCYVSGTINNAPSFSGGYGGYGGVVSIRNCYSNVLILKTGVQGYNSSGILGQGGASQIIENCIALGNISGGQPTVQGICRNDATATIKNCIAAMDSIDTNGNSGNGRILFQNSQNASNNYALDTMTVRGIVPNTSIGASLLNGANATINQLHSLDFYRDTMNWDMVNIWEIEDGVSFPRLRGFDYNF